MIRAIKSLQRSLGPGAILGILSTAILATPAYAGGDEPAGGAAIGEVIIATVAMSLLTGAVLAAGAGHRSGRISWLGRASDFTSRVSGLPGWAALPSAVSTVSLLTAVFGLSLIHI